jgi:4-hydroxy-3-methylbut-2-enyl diphosphate reductase IspH
MWRRARRLSLDFGARGIRTCTEVGDIDTATVMITAHGASQRRLAQLRARDLRVLNATCPLVRAAHRAVNTRELVATGRRHCARVFHVQTAANVRAEWLEGAEVTGITAGTSTPDHIIDEVETLVRALGTSEAAALIPHGGPRTPALEAM